MNRTPENQTQYRWRSGGLFAGVFTLVCTLCLSSSAAAQRTFTQNQFVQREQAEQNNSWQQSAQTRPPAGNAASSLPTSWPKKSVEFDEFVQQTNAETKSDVTGQGVARLIGTTIDSAGNALGNWKDTLGQKTDQLLATDEGASGWLSSLKQKANSPNMRRMAGSLALVVGGYLALVVVMRKLNPTAAKGVPAEVVEVLGHVPFGPKQNLQLVRLGSKLLLLINGPDGTHPVGEITDPAEADYLTSLCGGNSRRGRVVQGRATRSNQSPQRISQPAPSQSNDAQQVTQERLAEVLNRLERVTGGTANFEA